MTLGQKHIFPFAVAVFCLMTVLDVRAAHAATYYVDPAGLDTNAGTESQPFKTIQKASNVAKAGDTVYVKTGTYARFTITNSGSAAGGYITFSAAPGHERMAVVNGGATGGSCIYSIGKDYIAIKNFKVTNCGKAGIWVEGSSALNKGMRISGNHISYTKSMAIAAVGLIFTGNTSQEDRLSDVIIEDNEITKTNEPSGVNEGISVGNGLADFIIRNNHLYDSQQYGIDVKKGGKNGQIYGNHIHGFEKHAIYLDSAGRYVRDIDIHRNRMYNNRNGVVMARENGNPAFIERIRVFNNLIYGNEKYGVLLYKHVDDNGTGAFDSIDFLNNTLVGNGISGFEFTSTVTLSNIAVKNNIGYLNGSDMRNSAGAAVTAEINLFGTDPQFENQSSGDFHLRAGSAAIDAGTAVGVGRDYDGYLRSGRPDLGAYEYQGATVPPPEPTPPPVSAWDTWIESHKAVDRTHGILFVSDDGDNWHKSGIQSASDWDGWLESLKDIDHLHGLIFFSDDGAMFGASTFD